MERSEVKIYHSSIDGVSATKHYQNTSTNDQKKYLNK